MRSIRLTREEQLALFVELRPPTSPRRLDEVRSLLVRANLGLIWVAAKRCACVCTSLDIEDLVSEGVAGFLYGLRSFDPSYGTAIATHAVWWAHAYIGRATTKDRSVVSGDPRVRRLAMSGTLAQEHEALVETGVSADAAMHALAKKHRVSTEALRMAEGLRRVHRLDAPTPGNDRALVDMLPAWGEAPDETLDRTRARAEVADAVATLRDPRLRLILQLTDLAEDPISMSEVGKRLHLSRERIRQLHVKAIGLLKAALIERRLKKVA